MTGLFGGNDAKKSQKKQIAYANTSTKKALGQLDYSPIQNTLQAEATRLGSAGFYPVDFSTPGYGINVNQGGGSLTRTSETQGFMDRLLAGMGANEQGYNDLLSQIKPGFGDLTNATLQSIRNNYQQQYGNLREQLAKRRVLGASFADSQLTGLKQAQAEAEKQAIAESKVQELQMTEKVLQERASVRNQDITTGLSQIQYEGNIGANLTQLVSTSMQTLTGLQTDLVKLGAQIQAQLKTAASGAVTTLANTVAGSFPQYADLQAQIDAGPMNFIGTLGGALLGGGLNFGGSAAASPTTLRFPSGATSVGPNGATF